MYPFKILNKKKFFLLELNAIMVNMGIYAIPILISLFISKELNVELFLLFIILMTIVNLLVVIGNHIWSYNANNFFSSYIKDLELNYFKRIVNIPLSELNKNHSGFIKKQIDTATTESRSFLRSIFDNVNGFIISGIIFLVSVFFQDKIIFIICFIMILIVVIYSVTLGRRAVIYQKDYNQSHAEYNAVYSDLLQNIKTLKKLDADNYSTIKINNSHLLLRKRYRTLNMVNSIRFNGIDLFVCIMFFIILLNLYFKMKAGQEIIAYLTFYITIFTGIKSELRRIAVVFQSHTTLKAANEQLETIIGKYELEPVIEKWSKITIKNVEFKYEINSRNVIRIPNFILKKKDKVSIVGKSGQGKTTFLNIFSRFLKVPEGQYLIDNKNKKGRLSLAYISQDVDLLNVSLKENICLGKNIKESVIKEILEYADLYDWAMELPDKLDTIVGERGLKLSAGQKQRINIIRGIILDKDVYILDEPTSNLDDKTEEQIVKLIDKYLKEKTVIIVTHRPIVKNICNTHYVFENSTMKEEN